MPFFAIQQEWVITLLAPHAQQPPESLTQGDCSQHLVQRITINLKFSIAVHLLVCMIQACFQ